jgi:hypothetical protein
MAPGASTTFLLAAGLVFLLVLAIGVAGVVSPRSRRQLRFLARQSSIGPAVDGEAVVVDDAPVDAGTTAVVGARAGDCIVGAGDLDDLRSSLRGWGVRSAAGGLALTVLGYVGMLAVSGAV